MDEAQRQVAAFLLTKEKHPYNVGPKNKQKNRDFNKPVNPPKEDM